MKITIEQEGKVETLEADQALLILQDKEDMTLIRRGTDDPTALGLLELAQWHIKQAWLKANSK